MDFGDLASRYFQNRMDQATQPFTDPEGYANRRMQQDFGVDMNGNTKPIQTDTIKSAPMAQAPAIPAVPTSVGINPQPQAMPTSIGMNPAMPTPVQAQAPRSVQPIYSDIPGQEINNGAPNLNAITRNLPPQGAVQPAIPERPPVEAAPPVPTVPVNPAAPQQQPVGAVDDLQRNLNAGNATNGAPSTAETLQSVKDQPYIDRLAAAQNNPTELTKLQQDENTPDYIRQAAAKQAHGHLTGYQGEKEAQRKAADLEKRANSGDPEATKEIAREIQRPSEEGSYLKAYLFSRFGLNDLAKQEQMKLGAGSVLQHTTVDGVPAIVQMRPDGTVTWGVDKEGNPLSKQQMLMASGTIANQKTAQTQATHAYTTEKARLTKERDEWISRGVSEADLAARGLDETAIENRSKKIGADVLRAASTNYTGGGEFTQTPNQQRATGNAPTGGATTTNAPTDNVPAANAPRGIRNNNAGNIKDSAWTRSQPGYAGVDKDGFAKFNTPEAGDQAQHNLLSKGASYQGKTIAQAIQTYAPSSDNNSPKAYAASIQKDTGIDVNKLGYNDLNADQQRAVRVAMQKVENGVGSPSNAVPKTSILDNWEKPRPGEQKSAYDKRIQYSADDIRSEAQMLINGDKRLKDISGRDAGLLKHYASSAAKELDPTWNVADADSRYDALKKFTNPDSRISQQLRAHVTAAGAIDNVEAAYRALQNGNVPLFNQIRNDFRSKTGSDLPINAKTGAMILGPEIIKSIIPGGGGVTERLEAQHLLNVNLSPAQQKAVFDELKNFQGNSLVAMQNDWTKAKLPKDQFRERMLGDSPAAQELLDYAEKNKNKTAEDRKALNNPPPKPTAYEDAGKEARYQEWLRKRNSEKK